mmetsp:Transcript_12154/g.44356  ORF Transcript_12154/g.44356 Transcript_12154/m.44356 type:complete len:321 (-) Transcript_12154:314-1276(-)
MLERGLFFWFSLSSTSLGGSLKELSMMSASSWALADCRELLVRLVPGSLPCLATLPLEWAPLLGLLPGAPLMRRKCFCAWLATCVGDLVLTNSLDMALQNPLPCFSSPCRNSLCSSSLHTPPLKRLRSPCAASSVLAAPGASTGWSVVIVAASFTLVSSAEVAVRVCCVCSLTGHPAAPLCASGDSALAACGSLAVGALTLTVCFMVAEMALAVQSMVALVSLGVLMERVSETSVMAGEALEGLSAGSCGVGGYPDTLRLSSFCALDTDGEGEASASSGAASLALLLLLVAAATPWETRLSLARPLASARGNVVGPSSIR